MMKHNVKCPYCGKAYAVEGLTPRYCAGCANTLRAENVDSIDYTVGWLWARDCTTPEGTPNINTADAETINRLTGIGIGTCRRIVTTREKGYTYFHPVDLLTIRNIGVKIASKTLGTIAFGLPAQDT